MSTIHKQPDPFRSKTSSRCVLTIFTVVKSFKDLANIHQRNAIASWQALSPRVRVILFYDDERLPEDIETNFECHRVDKTNEHGTPLLDDVFSRVSLVADSPYVAFINADILIDGRLVEALEEIHGGQLSEFLAIGRRTDVNIHQRIDQFENHWINDFLDSAQGTEKASIVCKDYFVFTQGLFEIIPPFAVGRGNWDNWMVSEAKNRGIPVVDLSDRVTVIHQNHDYQHVSGGRMAAYVNGSEARENERLADGRNLIRGSTADWKLTESGIQKERPGNWRFWKDSPNFLKLMRNLLFFRR